MTMNSIFIGARDKMERVHHRKAQYKPPVMETDDISPIYSQNGKNISNGVMDRMIVIYYFSLFPSLTLEQETCCNESVTKLSVIFCGTDQISV